MNSRAHMQLQQSAARQQYLQLRLQCLEQTRMRVCARSPPGQSVACHPSRIIIVVNPSTAPLTRLFHIGRMQQRQRSTTACTGRVPCVLLLPIVHAVIVENALLFQLRRERVTTLQVARQQQQREAAGNARQ